MYKVITLLWASILPGYGVAAFTVNMMYAPTLPHVGTFVLPISGKPEAGLTVGGFQPRGYARLLLTVGYLTVHMSISILPMMPTMGNGMVNGQENG